MFEPHWMAFRWSQPAIWPLSGLIAG